MEVLARRGQTRARVLPASRAVGGVLVGIEEEVFITEPDRPTLNSLYYLARLLWRDPGFYYTHSASNFARGWDVRSCLMGGVEVATRPAGSPEEAVWDLAAHRRELAAVAGGLVVPVGHLFDLEAPTNTCGLHVHLGPLPDPRRSYAAIVRYLPVLAAMTVNSPFAGGRDAGASYRMQRSFAIGPLRSDWTYRFQDVIYSRRLGTIEIRVFDPFWDLERLRWLVSACVAVALIDRPVKADIDLYNRLREVVAREGYARPVRRLYQELASFFPLPERFLLHPPAEETRRLYRTRGTVGAYTALDRAYRLGGLDEAGERPLAGEAKSRPGQERRADALPGAGPRGRARSLALPVRAAVGFVGYFLPKAPYVILKAWREWREG